MTEWQPIETALKQQGPYLLFAPSLTVAIGDWDGPEGRWVYRGVFFDAGRQPTHWMPLPAPPMIAAAKGEG